MKELSAQYGAAMEAAEQAHQLNTDTHARQQMSWRQELAHAEAVAARAQQEHARAQACLQEDAHAHARYVRALTMHAVVGRMRAHARLTLGCALRRWCARAQAA